MSKINTKLTIELAGGATDVMVSIGSVLTALAASRNLDQLVVSLITEVQPPEKVEPEDLYRKQFGEREHSAVFIEELELSVRTYNCLKRADVTTLADLLQQSRASIRAKPNIGRLAYEEIVEALALVGLTLP